jgi:deoxyribodipyrimidine photo-lyase
VRFNGSEHAALAHLERYFDSAAPRSYKETRNELSGVDYSTKLSPWLAIGALSARTVHAALKAHESRFGANDSTYWIWFELLWRDFFRFASLQHGVRLFRAAGLSSRPPPRHDANAFGRWCAGNTGHALIDAGMRELAATGYVSNRLRQVVASYLIHELDCDWRAGAAWFESRLIDFDVYSNQGNWLYLAGRGADPRQGRRFNPDKQAATYDPDGHYRSLWGDP